MTLGGVLLRTCQHIAQPGCNAAGVTFEEALQVVVAFDRMPPRERKPWSRLPFLKEAAARYGVSVNRSP